MEDNNEKKQEINELESEVLTNIETSDENSNAGKVIIALAGLVAVAVGGFFVYRKFNKKKDIVITSNFNDENFEIKTVKNDDIEE